MREPSPAIDVTIQLADRIEEACDDVERVQLTSVTALDDEAMAWLMLCDRTGRATMAWVLQALVIMVESRAHAAALTTRRNELVERFAMFRQQARKLGVRAPLAALNVRAWRATSASVRAIRD